MAIETPLPGRTGVVPMELAGAIAVTPAATDLSTTISSAGVVPYITAAGNVTVTPMLGGSVTFTAVPAFTKLPVRCRAITAATATVVALY